jgi:hypothetical protein
MTLLPIVAGLIGVLEEERTWVEADYQAAYRAIAELEACMTALCVSQLVESNDRIYRLINWGLTGQAYDAGDSPPDTITPAIPAVPPTSIASPGLMRLQQRTLNLVDSSINGTSNADYSYSPSVRDLLQSVIDALATDDTDLNDIISQLEAIALLLG